MLFQKNLISQVVLNLPDFTLVIGNAVVIIVIVLLEIDDQNSEANHDAKGVVPDELAVIFNRLKQVLILDDVSHR